MSEKKEKNYAKRDASEFNKWRTCFQRLVCNFFYMIRFKLVYRLEVNGLENVPKTNDYIVCPNHLSTLDPPLMVAVMPRSVSFMAKQELFKNPFMKWWLDWLGAFAVNREKLGASTIKTARSIKNSEWVLGLFPQGTRGLVGEIKGITKGFAALAQSTKCGILPVGILGTQDAKRIPFSGKIKVNIGQIIPYSEDVEAMVQAWIKSIEELTGFKYVEA